MTISDEALEAAKKAYRDEFPYDENEGYIVKLVLEAAAPFIRAEALEEAAAERQTRSDALLNTMKNMTEMIGTYSHDDITRYGAYSVEAQTTAAWLRARAAEMRQE